MIKYPKSRRSNKEWFNGTTDTVILIIGYVILSALLIALVVSIVGCKTTAGFQPLADAKVADKIDIGDEVDAGRDYAKDESSKEETKQTGFNIQTVSNSGAYTALVIQGALYFAAFFLFAYLVIKRYLHYKEVKRITYVPPKNS